VVFDETVFPAKGTPLSQGSYQITATPGNSLVMIPSHFPIEHFTSATQSSPASSHSIPAPSTSHTAAATTNPDQLDPSPNNGQLDTTCPLSPTSSTHTPSQLDIPSPPLPEVPSNRIVTIS
jgi:hypothetical protein